MFWSIAYAQAAEGAAKPSLIENLMPMIVLFAIFYFFLIRPQSKRAKAHANFLQGLKRGEQVVTTGGMLGRIEGLSDEFVTLEVCEGVRIKTLRKQIASRFKEQNA